MNGLVKGQSSGYDSLTILERLCQHLMAALDNARVEEEHWGSERQQNHGLYLQDLATGHHFRCPWSPLWKQTCNCMWNLVEDPIPARPAFLADLQCAKVTFLMNGTKHQQSKYSLSCLQTVHRVWLAQVDNLGLVHMCVSENQFRQA